ncbi:MULTISPECIES: aminotransferase class V-fold PLP-dependent enzyme [unclassified Brevundimonas]|uniref:aminotransferase class V-fold PLP-dependent enzyme n=1 Tax=unclassified Brevundimonas TaxID=2622653 RepID=UPI000CFCA5C1|nr:MULTISPECIES: cysteine desulfurase [unclassified Brevundimonas]PRA22451.1 cysteine desulfurase [Brevundimonas sp. MYb27]PQZ73778.1 cysteine desulfurase [Brevundimonas sp. MYb31]PRB17057.1 cysteine desulfurase [Brevundimonas sp. MYb52]PRB37229.1 cysteine desulfurase [Brevundimonas sp. MYb46]PRB40978.1 cysteine desulfurase [Brevundimonas sp. MYb33]
MADGQTLKGVPVNRFDPYAARAQFPILSRQMNGKPLVYLDNAASAQKPRAVIDALTASMEGSYANVHRGLHTLSNEATEAFEAAREIVARFLNAPSGENIVWTKGGTEAINLVANGVGLSIEPGDEIIVSEMEHHSNIVPWHLLRERKGAVLKWAPIKDDGSLDMAAYAELLGPRTKVVAVTHMSNVLGTINPIAEITRLAHAAGARVLVDGCQGAVHATPDVQAVGCDWYVITGHKLYGPTGVGALYGTTEALESLPPYQGGGEMIETVEKDRVTYAKPPHRFEAGTPPILEAIGLGAALEWLSGFDRQAVAAHEMALYDHARARLVDADWLRVLGEAEGKGALLTFAVEGAHAHDVAQIMDRYGVAVRAGLHCAEPLAKRLGVTSSTRASFALYNTVEDTDAFVDALIKARNFFV